MPELTSTLSTPHGTISYTFTKPTLQTSLSTLLLIHGNSSSSQIFRPIFASPSITTKYPILALDLPGHGQSTNAPNPSTAYTQPAYAAAAASLLTHLAIPSVVVLGWSLGGHIAIEMMALLSSSSTPPPSTKLLGVMLTGTPPALGLDQINAGFRLPPNPLDALAAREVLTAEEIDAFAHGTAPPFEPWMRDVVARTDGRTRRVMFEAFVAGAGVDQRKEVETNTEVLVGIVNGGAEPFVNLEYLDAIKWANLWKGECIRLEGLGHAPFWEQPGVFVPLLEEFLAVCTGSASVRRGG